MGFIPIVNEKKQFKIIFMLLMAVTVLVVVGFLLFSDIGNAYAAKSESEIVVIKTAADLYSIALPENAHKDFVLYNDIDLATDTSWHKKVSDNEYGWAPISALNNTGRLNGNGYSILNLKIDRPDLDGAGLFSACALTIFNLNVATENASEGYAVVGGQYAGIIAADMVGSMDNVTARGTVYAKDFAGGLAGRLRGSASNSDFEGKVGGNRIGGLVGNSVSADIDNTYANAELTGKVIGGLVGVADSVTMSGSIKNSIAFATATVDDGDGLTRIGGFIGIKSDEVEVYNGYALDDYPCVAQGGDKGVYSLSKFGFITDANFNLDFKNIWYLNALCVHPKIRHLIVDVTTNSKYVGGSQILEKSRFYKDEKLALKIPSDKMSVESLTVNGDEKSSEIAKETLNLFIQENTSIKIQFRFKVEVKVVVEGNGSVKTDKNYYDANEAVVITATPQDNCELQEVRVRFNSDDALILDGSDGVYGYRISTQVSEGDRLTVYAVFGKEKQFPGWGIALSVAGGIIVAAAVVFTIIYLNRKARGKNAKD